jgi:hypothetical protein
MFTASVPEAAVDEDGELELGKGHVDRDGTAGIHPYGKVDAISQSFSMEERAKA